MVGHHVFTIGGIQYGKRVGHGGWLIGHKLFQLEALPAYPASKLCEFILFPVGCFFVRWLLFWMPRPEPEEKTFQTKPLINLGLSTIKDNTSRLPQAIVHASSSWRGRGRESLCSPGRWVGRSGRQVGRLGGCFLPFG